MDYIKIQRSTDDRFYFTEHSAGDVTTTSQMYTRKRSALKTILTKVKKSAAGFIEVNDFSNKRGGVVTYYLHKDGVKR